MSIPITFSQFDPTAELSDHTTVLEAGAGTGKTHTIAAIATRELANGRVTMPGLMLVTFGRSASYELRSRLHERINSSLAVLRQRLANQHPTPISDPVDAGLCQGSTDDVQRRIAQLETALNDFDAATIGTTHEFCSRLLGQLGILVDHDHNDHFMDDPAQLIDEVIDDGYLGWTLAGRPWMSIETARKIGRCVLGHPGLPLLEAPDDADEQTASRGEFAHSLRTEYERRKRRDGRFGYDDMVMRVNEALTNPVTGPQAAAVLRERYKLVMVDEFQDTSPAQWGILKNAFHGHTRLVVIGDPRQAIYAFRGADLHAYVQATKEANRHFTLSCNYRSDKAVVDGIGELFGRANLGTPQAPVHLGQVEAMNLSSRLLQDGTHKNDAAVQIRAISPGTQFAAGGARAAIRADLVRELERLLVDATLVTDDGSTRHLMRSDIAVLVRRRTTGQQIQEALLAAGIPAVFTGGTGIFASEAAQCWLTLLTTLADPRPEPVLHLASTPLIGWSPELLAQAGDDQRFELMAKVISLATTMTDFGIVAVYEQLSTQFGLVGRILSEPGGERLLTDLRHLTERLSAAQRRHHLGLAPLTVWLSEHIERAQSTRDDASVRRLDTERRAISVMTIHQAKGLQFPVVALPDMADRYSGRSRSNDWQPALLHEGADLSIDLFPDVSDEHRQAHQREESAEDLRLLYVAATRAQSRLIAWWANTNWNTSTSALHRLLNSDPTQAEVPRESFPGGRTPEAWTTGRDHVAMVDVGKSLVAPSTGSQDSQLAPVSVRTFHDHIDHDWTRTSYSGLTAGLHSSPGSVPGAGAPSEHPGLDEPDLETPGSADGLTAEPMPVTSSDDSPVRLDDANTLSQMPGGTQFGSLVHSVLEITDPASPTLEADLSSASTRMLQQWPVAEVDPGSLASGLAQVITTPLGSIASGQSLATIGAVNRLAEFEFEIPLGRLTGPEDSPDHPDASCTVEQLAQLWNDPALMPHDDPLADYGRILGASAAAPRHLLGFLTGSIDAVLRTTTGPTTAIPGDTPAPATGDVHFSIIDYKTNRIPTAPGELLGPHHYTQQAMTAAMIGAHYPLQALIYSVALHRHLRERLADYEPARHLGGVGYLFVRGMNATVSAHGHVPGVFPWHPRPELIVAASAVLAGRSHR